MIPPQDRDTTLAIRHDTTIGVVCLCASTGLFLVQDMILNLLSSGYPLSQAMVFRGLTALPLLMWIAQRDGGLDALQTPATRSMIARGVVMFVASAACCLALSALAIATSVAIPVSEP